MSAGIAVRAALLTETPGALAIEDLRVDDLLEPSDVRVRVVASGLCQSDLHALKGTLPTPLPTVPGHEVAGYVEAVGVDVAHVEVGDYVVACQSMFCRACRECLVGRTWLCERRWALARPDRSRPRLRRGAEPVSQLAGIGGFAEQVLVHASGVVRIPEEVPAEVACLLGCGVMTGVGSAINGARIRPGETVAVIGCGGVGLNVVQGARLAGAGQIVAVDLSAAKLDLARRFGATHVVDGSAPDAVTDVRELTAGGADHVFDVVGVPATLADALRMLRAGRTAYLVGVPPAGVSLELPGLDLLVQAKGVQALLMGSNHFHRDIPMLARLYLEGRLELDALVAERLPLERVNEGFDLMRAGGAARVVLTLG
ncbi:MAG TPA: Zn-dependent alcohol dehydrogenase [Nocardioides sp.]|uniref:Zn-dependent alcohol dehydrogenase n=1 Tax=Nocardioides sp. TaxID=35761 RepID=UPI002C668B43|nr:Zn-dependent alcohol dehydrogenase [Nocardioides sp.]HTW15348.1 Zn-dependent alcohol dehydrogenase [Nocardioides sp.]